MEQQLYYNGTSEETDDGIGITNNTQSSMSDLQILHGKEIQLLSLIEADTNSFSTLEKEFEVDGYNILAVKESDILNPIDSYNLIKRTSRTWARVAKLLNFSDTKIEKEFKTVISQFPSWDRSRIGVALGILNIHRYYDLDTRDLVQGIVKDNYRNITHLAKTRLTVGDAKLFAEVAESEKDLIGALEWLKLFPKLRKRYMKLAKIHDDLVNYEPLTVIEGSIRTSEEPIEETVFDKTEIRELMIKAREFCSPFDTNCNEYFRASDINHLCQGITSRPPERDMNVKCDLVNYSDPYIKLGPFRLETFNNDGNYVAVIHNLMSSQEIEAMKNKAKGNMKATPYSVGNHQEEFSYKRSSKIKYVSERNDDLALRITRRMELALKFNIFSPNYRFNAENYQLMNYGFGGLISLHFDAINLYYSNQVGGGRFTTSMVYLSDPESGGFTIFPNLGLYFKPQSGNMLFWNLKTTDGNQDKGMLHLGCPVLYGE